MTSMPASRSARAITLAPRSWPSRPGLAITTRSGRGIAAILPSHPRPPAGPTVALRWQAMAVEDPYDTLAVPRDASLDEIRIVYRRSIEALHPDRLAGASDAVRSHATQRLSALATAMEAIE